MRAIQITHNGGPEVLKIADVAIEKPGPGQALVRIAYAGINFIDTYQRQGRYQVPLPYIPGLEASGTVESVGEGVSNVKPGDRVAYIHTPGSYSEFNSVKADHLIPLPSELSFEQGAAFPLQGMTAHYLLHAFRKINKGDTILIHAAAGGMGLLLTQWAKHLGAHVIGTVSTEEKAKKAKLAGADDIIFYTKQNFAEETKRLTNGHGALVIIDGVGKTTFPGDLEAVAVRGNIIIFGSASGPADPISPNALQPKAITLSGGSLSNFSRTPEEYMFRALSVLEGLKQGWLKLNIDEVFPLEKAKEAHEKLEGRHTTGKLLLKT